MKLPLSPGPLRQSPAFLLTFLSIAVPIFVFAQNATNLPTPAHANVAGGQAGCGLISRNLKLGMYGEDVRVLQILLNNDVNTSVSDSGPGARGLETTYFGTKTQIAVIKFQELYRGEVLLPAGLTTGSGFVGAYTRVKLLALCSGGTTNPLGTTSPTQNSSSPTIPPVSTVSVPKPAVVEETQLGGTIPLATDIFVTPEGANVMSPIIALATTNTNTPRVNRPSSYVVSPGDKLSITGRGFTGSDNVLHIGTYTITNIAQYVLGTLETVLPLDSPKGKFDLWISNANGESNKSFLIVVEKGTIPPSVKSFTPTSGVNGTTIAVVGEGFTKENNEIYFGGKPITGISSPDGKTLNFGASMGIEGMTVGQSGLSTTTAPIWFYVLNANGISNNGIFTLTF